MRYLLRELIVTSEDLIFSVVSYSHPKDMVVAFLRYYPSAHGGRWRDGKRYNKVKSVEQSFRYLGKRHPEYLFRAENLGTRLQGVPRERIEEHLKPSERLGEIVRRPRDEVERTVKRLSSLFPEIPQHRKGVSGSVLAGLYKSSSDIDFVVYGLEEHALAREKLREIFATRLVKEPSTQEWYSAYRKRFPTHRELSFDEFVFYERRKFHRGVLKGKLFDLLLVDDRKERKPWGSLRVKRLRPAKLSCLVKEARLAFDYPAVYRVSCSEHAVREVVSYTHTYAGQAFAGEKIVARGYLEEVDGEHLRLVVGTTREAEGEYIKLA